MAGPEVSMRCLLCSLLLLLACSCFAQETPAKTQEPGRVCFAKIRNQTAYKFDLEKLRQLLMDSVAQSKLGKTGAIQVMAIEVDNSDDAQEAIQGSKCHYAIYTRILQQAPASSPDPMAGGIIYRDGRSEQGQRIMGVQCTVERTDTGIPALIDRQFNKFPGSPQTGTEKLLLAEGERVADAIAKKMAPAAAQ